MKQNHVGILCTYSPLKYGISKTGKPIYLCRPLEASRENVKLTYGGKLKGQIVVVFHQEKNEDDHAILVRVLGVVGDVSTLVLALQYHHGVYRKDMHMPSTTSLPHPLTVVKRQNLLEEHVFSIDPQGCRDIDDAFSFRGDHLLCVHIAQPIHHELDLASMLERGKEAVSTLYLPDGITQPLWPRKLEEKFSLLQDQERPAYTVLFNLSEEKEEPRVVEAYPSQIRNRYATHYEDTDHPLVQKLVQRTQTLTGVERDTHETVAYWMIQTNQYIGKTYHVPYRVQPLSSTTTTKEKSSIDKVFEQYTMEKATYSLDKDNYHASLDRTQYTHFTSPIRRLVDSLIHWHITYGETIEWDLDRLNELDQNTKRFHRHLALHNKVDTWKEGPLDGYLYEKISPGTWKVYFQDLGFLRVVVVHPKLEHLIVPEKLDTFVHGGRYPFVLHKKQGFLPRDRLLLTPAFSITA
jgi:exoribonuclease R